MGRDKALLPLNGRPLIERVAEEVRRAAGSATIIGSPGRYGLLGLPCIPDLVEGCGPLGGLYTALTVSRAEWNLVVACDLPRVSAALFTALFAAAERRYEDSGRVALVPSTPAGLEPLCAVYHRDLLPAVSAALESRRLRMHDFVASIDASLWPAPDPAVFGNVNTPADWDALQHNLEHGEVRA